MYITSVIMLIGISCVQFDDTRIVSGSSDKTIKVGAKTISSVLLIDFC